jgi:heme exporter protein C
MRKTALVTALVSALLILTGIFSAFLIAPEAVVERNERLIKVFSQKIFYFHVPVAETSLIAFLIGAIAGGLFLAKRKRKYDFISQASIELGLLFGILVEWSGIMWTRSEWGKWWEWEPRLTTYLILLLMYAGYFVLRSSVQEESNRARYAAVYSIIAAINVPLTFFAIRLIPAVHPVVFTSKGASMEPPMLIAFLISMFGMSLLYVTLLILRYHMHQAKEDIEYLKNRLGS